MNLDLFDTIQQELDLRKPVLDLLNRYDCSKRNYQEFKYFILTEDNDIVQRAPGFCFMGKDNVYCHDMYFDLMRGFPHLIPSRKAGFEFFEIYAYVLDKRMHNPLSDEQIREGKKLLDLEYMKWKPIHLDKQDRDPISRDIDNLPNTPEFDAVREEFDQISQQYQVRQKQEELENEIKSLKAQLEEKEREIRILQDKLSNQDEIPLVKGNTLTRNHILVFYTALIDNVGIGVHGAKREEIYDMIHSLANYGRQGIKSNFNQVYTHNDDFKKLAEEVYQVIKTCLPSIANHINDNYDLGHDILCTPQE